MKFKQLTNYKTKSSDNLKVPKYIIQILRKVSC